MTTHNEERDVFNSHCFDPFPEPQTMPAGWDLSALLSAPKMYSVTETESAADGDAS